MNRLTPEWEAFRTHAFALAADSKGPFPAEDARTAVPEALRPGEHKVHMAYVWLGSISLIAAITVGVVASSFPGIMKAVATFSPSLDDAFAMMLIFGSITLCVLLIAALVISLQWLSWKHLHYQLTPTEFNLYSGILNKKRLHLPYQRVQAVNQQAGILQRILGLCNVKIDTAGGSANEAVTLRYVRNADAEALRLELFRRKKVLLSGGNIDDFGNAFLGNSVLPSAWMIACCSGDERAAITILNGFLPHDATDAVFAHINSTISSDTLFNENTASNALDVVDNALNDIRGVFGGSEVATGRVSFETGLSNKELLLAGFSKAGGSLGVALVGALGTLSVFMGAFTDTLALWIENALENAWENSYTPNAGIEHALDSMLSSALVGMVGVTLAVVAVMWLLSALATIIRYGGFKARRRESRIEVEHGLLQRSFHGVDIDRIQSVIIKQSFIRRCIGYCELQVGKIDSTAEGDKNKEQQLSTQGVVVHPFVKVSQVPGILQGLAPELAYFPEETIKPAPQALRRAIIRNAIVRSAAFWTALISGVVLLGFHLAEQTGLLLGVEPAELALVAMIQMALWALLVLFAFVFIINTINAVLWHKRSGMGYDHQFVCITNGGLSSQSVMFPRKKIQFAYTKTNPFQRMAGVQTICARTAAGIGGTTEILRDLTNEDAEAWLEWTRPGGNQISSKLGVDHIV